MKDIASEIGMGKASLYYYFPTKDELFRAVIVAKHDAFLHGLKQSMQADCPVAEKIRTYISMRVDYFAEITNLNIVDFQNWHAMRPVMRATYNKFEEQELALLRSILSAGVRCGELRIPSAGKTAEAIIRVMRGLRCHFLRTIEQPFIEPKQYQSLKDQILFVTDLLLSGILADGHNHKSARKPGSRQHH